jgi:hypothetical protein
MPKKMRRPKPTRVLSASDPMDEDLDIAVQGYDVSKRCKHDWLFRNELGDWESWVLNPADQWQANDPKKLGAIVILASTKVEVCCLLTPFVPR